MARMIGFLATWTTYGTWLQGNVKGYVKDSIILKENRELEKANKALLKHNKVKLPKTIRQVVRNAILQEANEIGQQIYAIAVCSNHVHIVAASIGRRCGYSIGRFKKAATTALRKYGFDGNVWTKGFDKRYCYSEDELTNKIKYVERHESKF